MPHRKPEEQLRFDLELEEETNARIANYVVKLVKKLNELEEQLNLPLTKRVSAVELEKCEDELSMEAYCDLADDRTNTYRIKYEGERFKCHEAYAARGIAKRQVQWQALTIKAQKQEIAGLKAQVESLKTGSSIGGFPLATLCKSPFLILVLTDSPISL